MEILSLGAFCLLHFGLGQLVITDFNFRHFSHILSIKQRLPATLITISRSVCATLCYCIIVIDQLVEIVVDQLIPHLVILGCRLVERVDICYHCSRFGAVVREVAFAAQVSDSFLGRSSGLMALFVLCRVEHHGWRWRSELALHLLQFYSKQNKVV